MRALQLLPRFDLPENFRSMPAGAARPENFRSIQPGVARRLKNFSKKIIIDRNKIHFSASALTEGHESPQLIPEITQKTAAKKYGTKLFFLRLHRQRGQAKTCVRDSEPDLEKQYCSTNGTK